MLFGVINFPIFKRIIIFSVVIVIICYIIMKIILKKSYDLLKYFILFCFICYLQLLYWIAFGISGGLTFHSTRLTPNLLPFVSLLEVYSMGFKKMIIQVLLNIILTMPYGFLLPLLSRYFRSFINIILSTIFISILIEILQYFVGRSADIDDVIMNTLGGILGYMLFLIVNHYIKKEFLKDKNR